MAHRPHAASDILPGSIWTGEGAIAAVIASAAGYVEYRLLSGERYRVYHEHFRARFEQPYDARSVRSQFSMCMANLESFHAFWSPGEQRLLARSSAVPPEECRGAARGRPALPDDARYVGTYQSTDQPPRIGWHSRAMKGADSFFQDLNDLLATLVSGAAA